MTDSQEKIQKLAEILAGSWSRSDFKDDRVKITGLVKSDVVKITLSEIEQLAGLLKSSNPKVRYGTIKVLGLFGKHANPFVNDFTKDFFKYDGEQQRGILEALHLIGTKDVLLEYGKLLDEMQQPIQSFYKLVFFVSEFMRDYPLEGLTIISKISKFERIWEMYKITIQEVLLKESLAEDQPEHLIYRPPPIGMSQEQERRRVEYGITKMNIQTAIKTVFEQEKSKDKATKKEAKKILKKLKKAIL
ncbi:MAG: hypothetical protein GF308_21590 [Candidatus Heimdallarchaeota archaeon]|nr:hypothetical protein [Candidatus Heimdallarchaeota archaeon]